MSKASEEYRYEKLTWPEINDAVELGKVCIVPCGAVEQHGPHLPLDVDLVCPTGIAHGAGRRSPDKMLVLPIVAYGYTGHVMDFPGTINNDFEHFMHHVLDITKSLAYHGFKKIILLNGHGSNMPNLDLVARRTNLETDAECLPIAWWNLLTVDKEFLPALAAEQVPRRLRARLRAGDVAVPLPRRRQRPQGPDQERHDLASTRRTARSTGSTCSPPARRRSSRGRAATPRPACSARPSWPRPRRAGGPTRRRSSSSFAFVDWFKDRPKDVRRDRHRTAADDADPVGPGLGAVDLMPARLAEEAEPRLRRRWMRWQPFVFAAGGAHVAAALLGPDRELRFAVVGVEREVEVSVGAAQIMACGHDDDLRSAAGAGRCDAVVHEGGLLTTRYQ